MAPRDRACAELELHMYEYAVYQACGRAPTVVAIVAGTGRIRDALTFTGSVLLETMEITYAGASAAQTSSETPRNRDFPAVEV